MYEFELYFPAIDEHRIAFARKASELPARIGYNPDEYIITDRQFID